MRITETKTMPHPSGFGWGEYTRTRDLAAGESAPADAQVVDDNTPVTDWQRATSKPSATPVPEPAVPATETAPAVTGGTH